jgi:hypothetical protein
MQCSKCGSQETQRLEVAFEGGTQQVSTKSHTAGVGSLTGALGLAGAITKTSGTHQSYLAQKAAPPSKKPLKWAIILMVFGVFGLDGNLSAMFMGLALLSIGVGAYVAYSAVVFNTTQWPGLYQYWLESWICHKCGHIYHHA